MIKDNHLDSGYSIDFLVQKARKKGYKKIQVEVEDARSALIAAKCGATAILLDNFTPKGAAAAVKVLQKARVRKNVTLEVSGGITVKNIASFAKIGVDAISSGQITSSAPAIDLSLEVCTISISAAFDLLTCALFLQHFLEPLLGNGRALASRALYLGLSSSCIDIRPCLKLP